MTLDFITEGGRLALLEWATENKIYIWTGMDCLTFNNESDALWVWIVWG